MHKKYARREDYRTSRRGRHRLMKRPKDPKVSRREKAEKKQEKREKTDKMEETKNKETWRHPEQGKERKWPKRGRKDMWKGKAKME